MDTICIPMHLDAFALSPKCCEGDSKIAPYTQPNYVSLRLDSHLIQNDVLDHTTFHYASPVEINPRLADLGTSNPVKLKDHRMGIHLHWSLPKLYRSSNQSNPAANAAATSDIPAFQRFPDRWMVTRHLNTKTADPPNKLKEWQSWVIESNSIRQITQIPDDVDLESDITPFVSYSGNPDDVDVLKAQSEVFIGQKFDYPGWNEDTENRNHMPLTAMHSSNPLFPDFALHNTNVLSMIDNFAYPDPLPKDSKHVSYLKVAQASYFVFGWHSNSADDPFAPDNKMQLSDRLSNLRLKLSSNPVPSGTKDDVLTSQSPTHCMPFAAIYDVKYARDKDKPRTLADEAARKFTDDIKMEPLSVGITALDAILTFLEAHKTNTEKILGPGTGNIASDLLGIATLLYATADQYDARVQAQDLISQQNYAKSEGGIQWLYNGPPAPGRGPSSPSAVDNDALRQLNEAQFKLDITLRQLRSVRWDLFAEWWKYVSEYIQDKDLSRRQSDYGSVIGPLKAQVKALMDLRDQQQGIVDSKRASVSCKKASRSPFCQKADPTLCIAGLDSGWPEDFTDTLTVFFDKQLSVDGRAADTILGNLDPMPANLRESIKRLFSTCMKNAATQNLSLTTGFQTWGDRNPFVPLFIEWEAMYYHIDYNKDDTLNKWDVQVRPSPVGHPSKQVRWGVKVDLSADTSSQSDYRIISGRVLVLPQPTFSLEATVLQVLDNAGPDMTLTTDQVKDVRDNIRKMKFISAPLSGLTNHLLTRCDGAHVKPNARTIDKQLHALKAAYTNLDGIADISRTKIDQTTIDFIGAESALTPYGSILDFGKQGYPNVPFKPVTAGQMYFTKVNIIDKFGQAVCLPPPKPRLRKQVGPPSSNIYPCLSDYLAPDILNGRQNTVFPSGPPPAPGQWPLCQYIQLDPSINQDARINGSFILRDILPQNAGFSPWREASDYEQPIVGWIIINYADYGLQFFLPDGTFYREIRMGGPLGTDGGAKWLPFPPPAGGTNKLATSQLDQLINLFVHSDDPKDPKHAANVAYLQAFADMINGAIQTTPFPPSDYAGFTNAIVGQPLAIVNVGWSIELSQPAIKPQNRFGKQLANPQAEMEALSFPLKIGDWQRSFDGVVGYFKTENTTSQTATHFEKLYTYFPPTTENSSFSTIAPPNFPKIHPFWIDPSTTPNATEAATSKLTITTLIMDPYSTIHGYCPSLPTKSLKLPNWVVQTAFDKMTAFFRLGPSLLTTDVPATAEAAKAAVTKKTAEIRLPISGRKGLWNWLQPYEQDGKNEPEFVGLPVLEDHGSAKFPTAPYTFVEGYLQLVATLGRDDVKTQVPTGQ